MKGRCPRPLDDGASNLIGRSLELPHLVKLRVSLTLRQDCLTPFLSLALPDRHGEGETSPLVWLRDHPNSTPVNFHNPTADGQTHSEASGAVRGLRQAHTIEKNALLLFIRNARPAVTDAYFDPLVGSVKYGERDMSAIPCVFQGVLKQIEQHLTHASLIGKNLGQIDRNVGSYLHISTEP